MEALVFAGGDPVDERWHALLDQHELVIAADSGIGHVHRLGLRADVLVGDMDSILSRSLDRARDEGTRIEQHPADKDATDLELALEAALRRGADRVTVLGAGGGRLDHFLANALLLASSRWEAIRIDALVGPARLFVVRSQVQLRGRVGSVVTLLAVSGTATGVTTTGLRWELAGESLTAGTTRGVSNEMTGETATVSVGEGVLFAIQPSGEL
jgi:thiamine pyrophosphokinase